MQVNERTSTFTVLEKMCKGELYQLLEDEDNVFGLFVEFQGAVLRHSAGSVLYQAAHMNHVG